MYSCRTVSWDSLLLAEGTPSGDQRLAQGSEEFESMVWPDGTENAQWSIECLLSDFWEPGQFLLDYAPSIPVVGFWVLYAHVSFFLSRLKCRE